MRAGIWVVLALVVGCGKAGEAPPPEVPVSAPTPATPTSAAEAPSGPAITAQMTAATLADDCGGSAPLSPPPKGAKAQEKAKRDEVGGVSKAKRRCDQTSIQLSIVAPADAKEAEIRVKSVEIFDDAGASLGVVQAGSPRKWSEADGYVAWDQKVEPGTEVAVSYALSEPDWSKVSDRWNKTYVVRAVLSIGGADRPVETTVKVDAHASPTTMVKT